MAQWPQLGEVVCESMLGLSSVRALSGRMIQVFNLCLKKQANLCDVQPQDALSQVCPWIEKMSFKSRVSTKMFQSLVTLL